VTGVSWLRLTVFPLNSINRLNQIAIHFLDDAFFLSRFDQASTASEEVSCGSSCSRLERGYGLAETED